MSRSHILISLGTTAALVAARVEPLSPYVLLAAIFGNLAPDIDTPFSVLGRMLPFISRPLYKAVGHRTATHSIVGAGCIALLATGTEGAERPNIGLAFTVGYIMHIMADLLTIEGAALLYPIKRRRYRFWPAVVTGSFMESFTLVPILLLFSWIIYNISPEAFGLDYWTSIARQSFE